MLDRLSKRRQEFGVHPHDWDIRSRPSKRVRSRSSNDFPSVPSPTIFKDVAIPYSLIRNSTAPPTFEQYPAPGHVAAHLLLIECFHKLRHDVEASSTFGNDLQARNRESTTGLPPPKIPAWILYLALAIKRFRLWITRIESVIRHSAVFNRYGTGSHLHGAFTENYLPPIDVLFIWYAYLQCPASYERLIASNDFKLLSQICFPWHIITIAVDQNTLEYSFSLAASTLWMNLVGIPPDLKDCIDHDFDDDAVAFMNASTEMLDMALSQSDLIERLCRYQWLRSPSLHGTIRRAMSRYADQIMYISNRDIERTQQIPIESLEARSVEELDLDLPAQLILHTHRAYHSAWQSFAQLNNLKDEDMPPPPSYDESTQTVNKCEMMKKYSRDSEPCYCWICERIKDESEADAEQTSIVLVPLSQVSSPDDDKRTLDSSSSSDSEDSLPTSDLTRKQIKAIKTDVALFRHIENLRLKKPAK